MQSNNLATVFSRAQYGIDAPLVRVEIHISNGLPAFNIVGLPHTAVRESKERVRSALLNSHFDWPDRRITVNLSPADLPKTGGRFDLPIALGVLAASGQIPADSLSGYEVMGELALTGSIHPVPGTVSAAIAAAAAGHPIILPAANGAVAASVPDSRVIPCHQLLQLSAHLHGRVVIAFAPASDTQAQPQYPELADVRGQPGGRRALEVAAAGNHNLLLYGPPGTGKTMLASRLPGILPPPPPQVALQILAIQSCVDSHLQTSGLPARPFRQPHHSASAIALVGGGSDARPGEISLAHGGVLFLDELPEYSRAALEVLRQPMELGEITISRAKIQTTYPARFQLVAAMNPCPCGYYGDSKVACRCTPDQISKYQRRLSGPLLDRIDLHIALPRLAIAELDPQQPPGESSATVRARVVAAQRLQLRRSGVTNNQLPAAEVLACCQLGREEMRLLNKAFDALHMTARSYHRTLRVARSIADLEAAPRVSRGHLSEALAYRRDFRSTTAPGGDA